MSVQLARYLKDFGAAERAKPAFFKPPAFGGDERFTDREDFAMPPAPPPVDVEAERAEAFADGRAEAERELSVRHAMELAALKDAQKSELDALRHRYEKDYSAALAQHFSGLSEKVADLVAAQAAHVLAPVLSDALVERAIADLAKMIAAGLHEGEGLTVTVKGPVALFEQLKTHFVDPMPVFRHVEVQDIDLAVEFGEAVLVTRIAAWADTVRKVLA